jgi:hypothetical protein
MLTEISMYDLMRAVAGGISKQLLIFGFYNFGSGLSADWSASSP